MSNNTGDIVLIPFPFSELNNIKVRPAVVICETNDVHRDIVLSAISSKIRENDKYLILKPNAENNLKVESTVLVDRIFTLKRTNIIHNLGNISENELSKFKDLFKNLVD